MLTSERNYRMPSQKAVATSLFPKIIICTAKYSTNQLFIYVQKDSFINFCTCSNAVAARLVLIENKRVTRSCLWRWRGQVYLYEVCSALVNISADFLVLKERVERTSDFVCLVGWLFIATFEVGSWGNWSVEWQTLPLKLS